LAQATRTSTPGNGYSHIWNLVDGDANGNAITHIGASDRTLHVFGAFDGGTIVLQGSNDPDAAEWATLHDPSGAPLSFTSAGIALVAENPYWLRAIATGAGSGLDASVALLSRS